MIAREVFLKSITDDAGTKKTWNPGALENRYLKLCLYGTSDIFNER
jgi:hypothetical protein